MEQESETEKVRKNWFYIISPCIIAGVLAILGIIDSYLSMKSSEGWSFLGVIIAVPFLAFVIILDLILKSLVKKKVLYVWLIETILILVVICLLKYYFG
jgi:hypothetical protein